MAWSGVRAAHIIAFPSFLINVRRKVVMDLRLVANYCYEFLELVSGYREADSKAFRPWHVIVVRAEGP